MKLLSCICAGVVIVILALFLFGCSRKVQIQTATTKIDSTSIHKIDSLTEVNHTLSQAYESLLATNNNTDVVFECPPCDSNGHVSAAGMPHVFNRIIVDSKGNKTFEGAIKSYREAASSIEKKLFTLNESYDSLSHHNDSLAKDNKFLHEELTKKSTTRAATLPIIIWIGLIAFGLLWINERFQIFRIPFVTKLFTKK